MPYKSFERKSEPSMMDLVILQEYTKVPVPSLRQLGKLVNRSWVTVKVHVDWLVDKGYLKLGENALPGQARALVLTYRGFSKIDPIKYPPENESLSVSKENKPDEPKPTTDVPPVRLYKK